MPVMPVIENFKPPHLNELNELSGSTGNRAVVAGHMVTAPHGTGLRIDIPADTGDMAASRMEVAAPGRGDGTGHIACEQDPILPVVGIGNRY